MIRRSVRQVLRILLTGSAFLSFFTGGAILSYLVLPVARLRERSPAAKARACRRIVRSAWILFHDYMRLARLVVYDPRRTRLDLPDGPFVLVANHPTLVDVTALVSSVPDAAIVAKSILFRSPLVGRLLRYCGHIEAGEGLLAGAAVADQALAHLKGGTPVLVFPEGTRSPRLGLGPFSPGAFQIAARAGVPVVSAFIRCDPPTLMRGEPWYRVPPRTAALTVEQCPTSRPTPEDAREVARSLEKRYLERLGAPRAAAG